MRWKSKLLFSVSQSVSMRVSGELAAIPADFGRKAGLTLDRAPIQCRTTIYTSIYTFGQFWVASWANLHVIGLWEENQSTQRNPTHANSTQIGSLVNTRIEPGTFLLWNDKANTTIVFHKHFSERCAIYRQSITYFKFFSFFLILLGSYAQIILLDVQWCMRQIETAFELSIYVSDRQWGLDVLVKFLDDWAQLLIWPYFTIYKKKSVIICRVSEC